MLVHVWSIQLQRQREAFIVKQSEEIQCICHQTKHCLQSFIKNLFVKQDNGHLGDSFHLQIIFNLFCKVAMDTSKSKVTNFSLHAAVWKATRPVCSMKSDRGGNYCWLTSWLKQHKLLMIKPMMLSHFWTIWKSWWLFFVNADARLTIRS